jgi:hypothetical protein
MRCTTSVIAPLLLLASCRHAEPPPEPVPIAPAVVAAEPSPPPPTPQVVVSGPPIADASPAPAAEAASTPDAASTSAPATVPDTVPDTVVEETVTTNPPFRSDLTPYGVWMVRPGYGWVWVPSSMPPDWRPYTYGHWVWVDECGWTWVADEPYGTVVYHYGRWYFDASIGWAWVPGTIWGPSWVVWRSGGGFVGWAPMPPVVEVGFVTSHPAWVEAHVAPTTWVFVEGPRFCAPTLRGQVVVATRNVEIVHATKNITNVTVTRGRVVDRSLDVRTVERFGGPPVPRAHFVQERDRATLVERRGKQETRHAFAMPAPSRSHTTPSRPEQPQPPKQDHGKKGGGKGGGKGGDKGGDNGGEDRM